MDRYECGSPLAVSGSLNKGSPQGAQRSDLEQYTLIQASFSAALAAWQERWQSITEESLKALASHGIAISFRQSVCGGYVATLLHRGGGGIDSGRCPSLLEARRIVLGHGLEEGR